MSSDTTTYDFKYASCLLSYISLLIAFKQICLDMVISQSTASNSVGEISVGAIITALWIKLLCY